MTDNFRTFKVHSADLYTIIRDLQRDLGKTDPYMPFKQRTWYTNTMGEVYIRRDIDVPKCITFHVLKEKVR